LVNKQGRRYIPSETSRILEMKRILLKLACAGEPGKISFLL
jgi:hypothetical protein